MALKDLSNLASRLRTGATIAVATASLTTCNKDGAVDPAPPPADCSTPATTQLIGYASQNSDGTLSVSIETQYFGGASFSNTQVTELVGVEIVSAPTSSSGEIALVLRPSPAGTKSGSFHVTSTLKDAQNKTCGVDKVFTFTIMSGSVQISSRHISALPLDVRYPAAIAMIAQEGSTLTLQAQSGYAGDKQLEWSVTGGVIEAQTGDHLRWQLPEAPGLYQVELVIDYGEGGFAIDHMTFEVSTERSGEHR